jgi:hypothetical protein
MLPKLLILQMNSNIFELVGNAFPHLVARLLPFVSPFASHRISFRSKFPIIPRFDVLLFGGSSELFFLQCLPGLIKSLPQVEMMWPTKMLYLHIASTQHTIGVVG